MGQAQNSQAEKDNQTIAEIIGEIEQRMQADAAIIDRYFAALILIANKKIEDADDVADMQRIAAAALKPNA